VRLDGEGQTFETPVWDEINIFRNAFSGRNVKTEMIISGQIDVSAAKFTRKDAIRFVENDRRSALRALLFNLKVRAVHRIYCNR